MEKTFRDVDKERGFVQVTTSDERWYARPSKNVKTGLPDYEFVPSVTFITGQYPKGVQFMQWYAKHGYDEAERIKSEAGDRGTAVHRAIEVLLQTGTFAMDQKVADRDGNERDLTVDEYACVMSFVPWWRSLGPVELIRTEHTVWSKEHGYAGTLDLLYKTLSDGKIHLDDIKTSQSVYPSHEMQVSALARALLEQEKVKVDSLGIIQVGYRRNKAGFKFTEVDDQFDLFLATKKIWAKECGSAKPSQIEYPLVLKLVDDVITTAK